MNLSVGIVGLPNVGKSTLFNALLKKQQAFVANFPFATIEQNVGIVPVPDGRLAALAKIIRDEDIKILSAEKEKSPSILVSQYPNIPPIVPATVKFVDIAGLVKGANEGAGLGNKFLSHIREVSIIAHVIRAFEDENIVKEGSVDPKSDYETIQTELILADLSTISKIKNQKSKIPFDSVQGGQIKNQKETAEKIFDALNKGIPAREVQLTEEERELSKQFFLLSSKPEIIVLNVSESDYSQGKIQDIIQNYARLLGVSSEKLVVISAKIESELASLSDEEQKEYLNGLGIKESGLERLIKKAYETLGLISFLTAGEKEVRAWTIKKGTNAIEAAGEIHTDFMKKFIKAEVVSYNDFVSLGGWKGVRQKGKARLEGRDYIMQDGDVVEFKIGS